MANVPSASTALLTTSSVRRTANSGQILLFRNGAIAADYGDTRVTASDYGNGIKAAFAALQSGDELVVGPMIAEGVEFGLTQSNVKLFFSGCTLKPNADYSFIFQSTGADVLVQGLVVDGYALANNSVGGTGIWIDGDRNRILDCEARRTRGLNTTSGSAFYVGNCKDTVVDRLYCYNAKYSGIILNDVQRCELHNVLVHDCIDRAVNIQGDEDMDLIKIRNFHGIVTDTTLTTNGPGINVNNTSTLSVLDIDGLVLHVADTVAPGISYDDVNNRTLFKIQETTKWVMKNAHFIHGRNDGDGQNISVRLENVVNGHAAPEEIIWEDVILSDDFQFQSNYLEYMNWNRVHLGHRSNDLGYLAWYCRAKEWIVRDSVFNMHAGTAALLMSSSHASTDYWEFVNNRFIANKASTVYVVAGGELRDSFGNGVWYRNTLENPGGGTIGLSNSEIETLQMTTDHTGNLLWDEDIVGSGINKHPDSGSSAPWFSTCPVGPAGTQIVNTRWTNGDTKPKCWQSNGTSWEAL